MDYIAQVDEHLQSVGKWNFGGVWFCLTMASEFLYCWGWPPLWGWALAAIVGWGFANFAGFFSAIAVLADLMNEFRCQEEEEEEINNLPVGQPVREATRQVSFVSPAAPVMLDNKYENLKEAFAEHGERIDIDGILDYIGQRWTDEEKSLFVRKESITTSFKFYADMNFCSARLWPEFCQKMINMGYFKSESVGVSPTDDLLDLAAGYVTVT